MSILKKPYEISVWEDRWDSDQGKFVEVRLGIIGTDKMIAQCRAIEPNLVRNVNGTKKFSFKMYKQYVDIMTGEKVSNPFSDWLISERKVKLHYEDKWFDFIIKDIAENSSNYLYTYQLEDALVQELSKNGFGVTLDAQLMNNMGTAGELGAKVLEETDWTVQSEVFVQKVEEALVYVQVGANFTATKILDQTGLNAGVSTEQATITAGTTILAFYSSCTEQPYRFQFIKLDDYANVSTDENRVINVANCQYYYDVLSTTNVTYEKTTQGFYLPKVKIEPNEDGKEYVYWQVCAQGPDATDDKNDTTVSNWYRGARYGFAQDAEYVPLLDRYCQKFFNKTNIFNINNDAHYDKAGVSDFKKEGSNLSFSVSGQWDGLKLASSGLGLAKGNTYRISYKFQDITDGSAGIEQIGGRCAGFQTKEFYLYQNLGTSGAPLWKFLKSGSVYSDPIKHGFVQNTEYLMVATLFCERVNSDSSDSTNIYIQPNRGIAKSAKVQVSDIQIQKMDYAFVDNTYTSPALVQNVISSPNGEKTSGWTAATIATTGTKTKPEIESVYGRFDGSNFISIIDDLQGTGITYKDSNTGEQKTYDYKSYLKVKFTDANQRLINSGFYDNRTLIGSVTTGEKWKLKPTLVGAPILNYSLSEVEYNTTIGCHNINTAWTNPISLSGSTEGVMIFSRGTGVSEKEFKKKKIKLIISPSGTPSAQAPVEFYIKNLELYKAVPKTEGGTDYISPGELDQSGIITTTYNFFSPAALEVVETAEELACEKVGKSELYTKYTPVFNENAEKVRSVTTKESNYFNILQSVAETFECWLSLDIVRAEKDDPDGYAEGAIKQKIAKFKNYAGNDNYAAFRYGVNLKDIQRTFTSKNIVTKLMVKANSNEHAQGGFCTVQRASANPTGESYLYDFQYYHNKGLLRAEDFIHNYYINNLHSPSEDHNVDYAIQKVNEFYSISTDEDNGKAIVNSFSKKTSKTNYQVLFYAKSSIADGCHVRCDFYNSGTPLTSSQQVKLTNNKQLYILDIQSPEEIIDGTVFRIFPTDGTSTAQWPTTAQTVEISGIQIIYKDTLDGYYPRLKTLNNLLLPINQSIIDLNTDLTTLRAEEAVEEGLYYAAKEGIEEVREDFKTLTNVEIDTNSYSVENGSKAYELQKQFAQYTIQLQNSFAKLGKEPDVEGGTPAADSIKSAIAAKEAALIAKEAERDKYLTYKKALNKLFFEKYARFIQEGTWISEEYVDDDKYYIDAQSVLYNSCYPQVAYTINVLALSRLPGYELFEFGLGDKTYAEDPEFFEEEGGRVEVIISEKSENLDDPTKDVIRVQNFKNQFQDLFQKITATVQQTQYSTGAYKKAVALAEADVARKGEFLSDALSDANAKLSAAGQTTVEQDIDGITLTDSKTNDKMRLIGGAILMGVLDENGERKWKTGLTPEGISASLVTAGTINTGSIAIMDGNNPAFRWDAFGISAFNADWNANGIQGTPDKTRFVRFDKHGIYGIDGGVDGTSWRPTGNNYDSDPFKEIDARSTFALTWKGLKVTGGTGGTARLGKQDGYIMLVHNSSGVGTFGITEDGRIQTRGIEITSGTIGGDPLASTNNIKDAVDSINIGGRNLLTKEKLNGYNQKKEILNNSFSKFGYIRDSLNDVFGQSSPLGLKADTNYTISFSAWATTDTSLIWDLWVLPSIGNEGLLPQKTFDLTTTPAKYSWTVSSTAGFMPQAELRFLNFDKEGNKHTSELPIYITDIQIEEGTKATTWSPAPEDVTAEINATNTLVTQLTNNLQAQIDGEITTWFYEGAPTLSNVPAVEWANLDTVNNNNNEKNRHLGDLYYDTATQYAYRWTLGSDGVTFEWKQISDVGVTEALRAASKAQETADGKATVFSAKPEVAYQYGDLIIPVSSFEYGTGDGKKTYSTGKIYRCKTKGEHESFDNSHWEEVSYTDNTELDTFKTNWGQDKEDLERLIDGCIKTDNLSITESTNSETGIKTTTTILNGETTTTYTSPGGNYILTNIGVSGESDGQARYFQVSTEGLLRAENAVISGKLMANEGYIAGWDITRTENEKSIKTGKLGDTNSFHMYAVGGNDGADGTAAKPYLFGSTSSQTWMLGIGSNFGVTNDGAMYASAGSIGGWEITDKEIFSGNVRLYKNGAKTTTIADNPSLIISGGGQLNTIRKLIETANKTEIGMVPPRTYLLEVAISLGENETISSVIIKSSKFYGLRQDGAEIAVASYTCTIDSISENELTFKFSTNSITKAQSSFFEVEYEVIIDNKQLHAFSVLSDGSLYASKASITGDIYATSGLIGSLKIDDLGLYGLINDTRAWEINGSGLRFDTAAAGVRFGNSFYLTGEGDNGQIVAEKNLEIIGNKTAIKLNSTAGTTREFTVSLNINYYYKSWGTRKLKLWLSSDKATLYKQSYMVKWRTKLFGPFESGDPIAKGEMALTWQANTLKSQELDITFSESDWDQSPYFVVQLLGTYGNHVGYFGTSQYGEGTTFVLETWEETQQSSGENIVFTGNLLPNEDGKYNLGENSAGSIFKWNKFFVKEIDNGSDRKIKDNITNLQQEFSKHLIFGLKPKSYTFKNATTPRTKFGFIAQDVEELLLSLNTSTDEIGIVSKSKPNEPDNEDNHYTLNYTSFIAPMVSVIQDHELRTSSLEQTILDYETRISTLEQQVQSLTSNENSAII